MRMKRLACLHVENNLIFWGTRGLDVSDQGTVERSATKESGVSYLVTGIIEAVNDTTLKISELPVRKWTQDYKEYLESLMVGTEKNKEAFIEVKATNFQPHD